jgi:hypothetical protein
MSQEECSICPRRKCSICPRRNVQYVPGRMFEMSQEECSICPRRNVRDVPGGLFEMSQEECSICPRRNVRDVPGQQLAHTWRFFSKCIKVPKSEGPSRSLSQYEISPSICLSQNDLYVPTFSQKNQFLNDPYLHVLS